MDDDDCPRNRERFVDSDKCHEVIRDLHQKLDACDQTDILKCRCQAENLVERFQKLVDPYQEQPELLEPYLSSLIEALTEGLSDANISSVRYHTIFKFLYQLIKVAGFKSIGKKFPHDTSKLPLLVELLSKEDFGDKFNWQTRFVLTVWLSIVILVPFDLAKFESPKSSSISNEQELPKLSERIYSTLYKSLQQHDSCQHVTSYCMAKFFSRSDVLAGSKSAAFTATKGELAKAQNLPDKFIEETLADLADIKMGLNASSMEDVKLIGHLRTLAYMFKFLPRQEMKSRAEKILNVLTKLDVDKINRELINHIIIKLIQRAGLALLPKRANSWRYKRGSRILGQAKAGAAESIKEAIELKDNDDAEVEEEEVSSVEHLEDILSVLFVACQNNQTRIRWSAAKGIARLSSRLSRERASDVIDMILGNFFELETNSNEFAWHGGCLTLAEMSRNGLILEEKLDLVIRIISNAIIYDKIKGSFAVGSHVREAACYVCWAMARSYEDHLLAAHIPSISINLLCTMLFDRELQCRRAASATFQELVGRQGTFNEEGISILNNVDYQNVGQRQLTYTSLASKVASFNPNRYGRPFVEHLLDKKVGHWDVQIRRLATDSLAGLMVYLTNEYVESTVLTRLMEMIEQNLDNNAKHGATLAIAKVIHELAITKKCQKFKQQLIDFMGSIVTLCEKQLKSKQQAPNFIEAIGLVIASCEAASFDYPEEEEEAEELNKSSEIVKSLTINNKLKSPPKVSILKQWESVALSALDSDNSGLRDIGSDALLTLYKTYYKRNKACQDRILTTLNKSLNSLNESRRCGSLKALSKLSQVSDSYFETNLPSQAEVEVEGEGEGKEEERGPVVRNGSKIRLDSDTPNIILMSITGYIAKETHERKDNIVFAHAKAEACEALVNFVCSLDKARILPLLNLIRAAYDALLEKTEDFTLDKRGDIGVVVRQAAMRALLGLTIHLQSINLTSVMFDHDHSDDTYLQQEPLPCCLFRRIITKFLQQSVSYHNSARELAASSFYKLVTLPTIPDKLIPHRAFILSLFDQYQVGKQDFNWRTESTPIFVNLLTKEEYNADLWIGLLPSIGQASDLGAKPFREAISDYIRSLSKLSDDHKEGEGEHEKRLESGNKLELVFNAFLECLSRSDTIAERLLTSGLTTADYLLSHGLMNETSASFQERLADFCWQARLSGGLNGKPDPKRLVSIARVLCSMLQLDGQVQITCLKYCLQLLANGFVRVRVCTAEQFYLSVMTYQSELEENLTSVGRRGKEQVDAASKEPAAAAASSSEGGEETHQGEQEEEEEVGGGGRGEAKEQQLPLDLDKAMELLSQTDWTEPLEKLRPIRDQISACFALV